MLKYNMKTISKLRYNESEYQYGLRMEKIHHPIFNDIFKKEFDETDKWCEYDFVKDNIYIELKSRKCKKDTFPTTIIGMSKIKKYEEILKKKPESKIYIFVNFLGDLYYWLYKENNYTITNIQRKDRKYLPGVPHLNIPIEDLTKIKYTDNI
jgi:hypothetical protein